MAFTKVVGPGIHTLSNITSHNVHSSGIITATRFDGPFTNLNVTGVTTFGGSVSIAGTLTYEDVTNIDSVGIVTARDGIKIPFDNKFLLLGQSNDLSLAHTAGHSYIADTGTGGLYLTGSNVRIQNATQNEDIAVFNQNDSVDLYYDNVKQFETSAKGIQVGTGVTIETNGQAEIAGITTFYKDVHIKSGTNRLYLGTGNQLSLIADPSHSYLRNAGSGSHFQIHSNNFGVRSYDGNGSIVLIYAPTNDGSGSGGVQLYHYNGSGINPKRFQTTTQGIEVLGHSELDNVSVAGVTTTTGDVTVGSGGENSALGVRFNSAYAQIKLPDGQTGANRKGNLSFGDNDDFRIVHDGHHNYCLLYTSPSPRDRTRSRMPSSA